jgi:hypothetical protein
MPLQQKNENRIYAWDFILSGGDTIKEKYDDLYEKIKCLCFKRKGVTKRFVVKCDKQLASIFAIRTDFCPLSSEEFKENPNFMGTLTQDYDNGYEASFELHQDETCGDDILICGPDETSIVKVFNFPRL